jgi:hypothetical protein
MKWRKFNIIIHRDLGYLCFGLTIIYAISGVAVNHIQDWNPTYVLEKIVSSVNLAGIESADNEALTSSGAGAVRGNVRAEKRLSARCGYAENFCC